MGEGAVRGARPARRRPERARGLRGQGARGDQAARARGRGGGRSTFFKAIGGHVLRTVLVRGRRARSRPAASDAGGASAPKRSACTARAGNRRFRCLHALRAHTKGPYEMDFRRQTLRALNRPKAARTVGRQTAARPRRRLAAPVGRLRLQQKQREVEVAWA
jgi:hypothetical protein